MSTNNPPVTSSAIPINNNNTMDRRGSVSTAVFSTFFHRANSMSAPTVNTDLPRRRQSTTATGPYPVNYSTSPTSVSPALSRRSTFDENAIEDDDVPSPLNGRSPVTSNRSSRRASFSLQPRTLNGTYTLDSSSPGTSGTQTPAARTQRPSVSGGPAKSALTAGLRDAETPALRGSYLAGAVRRLSVTGSAAASAAASAIQASETSPSSPASSSHFRTSSFSTPLTNPLSSSVPRNADQVQSQYFTWSDQLRNRAEGRSAIAGSPPRMGMSPASYGHMRSGSLSAAAESASMRGPNNVGVSSSVPPAGPVAPVTAGTPTSRVTRSRKPDAFQERILKGDFYMD